MRFPVKPEQRSKHCRDTVVNPLPKEARQVFGLSPGDSLLVLGDEENGIVLARAEVLNHVAMEILGKVNSPQKDERE